ncbi:GM22640 [Drosophila sechellia]|uniref:GM22640 n=2 Tax=Drosophila sechellia TaxID=7238 RepID=B4I6E1_DROSE|nr:GM22640 [Drosophila sechellia]
MFSDRYNNKRREFYERYEAARVIHPSLPECQRPVEPTEVKHPNNPVNRRPISYRQLANQSQRQLENDSWLSSDRLPIVVRREIEMRNKKPVMPKYNVGTATHVLSHNGGSRRGRPPSAATAARLASEFARQVGGISQTPTIKEEEEEESEEQPKAKKAMPDKVAVKVTDKLTTKAATKVATKVETQAKESNFPVKIKVEGVAQNDVGWQPNWLDKANQGFATNRNFIPILSSFPNPYRNMDVTWTEQFNALSNLYYNHIMNSVSSSSQMQPLDLPPSANTPTIGVNPVIRGGHPPFSVFPCPSDNCKQNFDSRRAMYKHQRVTGHHNWPHNCSKCGQVFRTSGFMRMHSVNACERNLHKFKISKPN